MTRPVAFSLVVNDFGVKYVGREHANHLVNATKKHYPLSEDWEGALYCGISLEWNYDEKWVEFGMPKYVNKGLKKFLHSPLKKLSTSHSPSPHANMERQRRRHAPLRTPPKFPGTYARACSRSWEHSCTMHERSTPPSSQGSPPWRASRRRQRNKR